MGLRLPKRVAPQTSLPVKPHPSPEQNALHTRFLPDAAKPTMSGGPHTQPFYFDKKFVVLSDWYDLAQPSRTYIKAQT